MNSIRFIKNNIIDKKKWDLCVEGSVNRTHYALSWYLDIVADKWDAVVYGDYELIFPVTYKNIIPFIPAIKIISQPMFCQQLGFFRGRTQGGKISTLETSATASHSHSNSLTVALVKCGVEKCW